MLTLTEPAVTKLAQLLHDEAPGMFLRIAVASGGCSGFRYEMFFDTDRHDADTVVPAGSFDVVVDPASAPLLTGATIDWRDSLTDSGFKIDNPNATRSCGCGKSFGS